MGKALLACSGGGHLKQLFSLAPRLGIAPEDQVWYTFDNGLSRSLLRDRQVVYAPYVKPRDVLGALRLRSQAKGILRGDRFDLAVSTGAIPGLASLPVFASAGVPSHFIESAARAEGPSATGRLLSRFRKVHTYTQYPSWADDRWQFRGSIYDSYTPGPESARPTTIRRAVVTVGTTRDYQFDRLYRALIPLLADCDEVLWQTGDQDVSSFGIDGREKVPHDELKQAIAEADVVIAHCGTGSALTAFDHGKLPILVPRWARHGEHIDDHQVQIGREMQRRDLAILREAEDITYDDLLAAASRSVIEIEPPLLALDR